MAKEYIERGAAYKFMFDIPNPNGAGEIEVVSVDDLDSIPAVDVVPVRHGRWINGHCTRCGEDVASRLDIWTNIQRFLYCPFCGVRMDGDGE